MPKSGIELTEAEWVVIKTVWEKEPCSAPEVQLKLEKKTGWSYSTVRTLMDRMAAKGILAAEKIRNLTHYRSAITRRQAQRSEILYALKNAFNGALTPMMQCLLDTDDISEQELAELEALVKEKRKGQKELREPKSHRRTA